MNLENAKKLVDQLERLPDEKFDIGVIIHHKSCGTVACVAGWAALLNGGPPHGILDWAADWLGMDYSRDSRIRDLFLGHWGEVERKPADEISRVEAIDELKRLIAKAEGHERPSDL